MLSKNMYEALTAEYDGMNWMRFRDGRTLNALWNRGLIKANYYRPSSKRPWVYTLTKAGESVRSDLLGMSPSTKKNIFRSWRAGQ